VKRVVLFVCVYIIATNVASAADLQNSMTALKRVMLFFTN
jgi:hypothetical protein